MYIAITKQHQGENFKRSVGDFVKYLEKENEGWTYYIILDIKMRAIVLHNLTLTMKNGHRNYNLEFKKQSSVWQWLFYITANYGTNENMRRRHRLKEVDDPVVSFNQFSELEGYFT